MIKIFRGNLKKIFTRLALGVFLVIAVFAVTIVLLGYFAASKPVSYLPVIHPGDLKSNRKGLNHLELKNSSYVLSVQETGEVIVETLKGDTILSSLTWYASHEGQNDKLGLDNISTKLTSDSTISITGIGLSGVLINYILTVPKERPKLDISIKSQYTVNTIVRRESLIAGFDVSPSEVYRKNRQVDVKAFDPEYWLQRQGVRFGSGEKSAMIYHTPYVSSLQLDTKKNMLFINLEYYLDHPFVNIPYQADEGGRWIDISDAKFVAGDERDNNFSIYFGSIPKLIPRFMLVPGGYLAGYVFTEHADGGEIRKHRAAYFGSEDISMINDATGGFAGHKIPVTKSVFYVDPDSALYSSVIDDPDFPQFLDFLDQLNESGLYDICLHSPENLNSNREVLKESIEFMKNRFDTKTWIDHGMYGGKINREAMVAEGLNQDSKYYSADLWEKYGTQYFWSPAVELIRNYSLKQEIKKLKLYEVSVNLWKRYLSPEELHKISFFSAVKTMSGRYLDKGEANSLLSYKGSAFPTPLYWKHPTQTQDFYSWTTEYEKEYGNLSEKKVDVERKLLDKLVSDWGVFINHGYYVRNSKKDGNITGQNGKLVINPYFDKILGIMAQMRDKGDLYTTTVRDLLDYWIMTENITFDYMPDGTVFINNNNDKAINGLSLVVHADDVRINGEIPRLRKIGENTIFWFDIPSRSRISLRSVTF